LSKTEKTTAPSSANRRPDVDQVRWLSRLCDRLDAVDQQVDYHLLQLNPFALSRGEPWRQICRHSDPLREDCIRFGGSIRGQS
jgi:hypothetical protein